MARAWQLVRDAIVKFFHMVGRCLRKLGGGFHEWAMLAIGFFGVIAAAGAIVSSNRQIEEMRSERLAYVYANDVHVEDVHKFGRMGRETMDVSFPFSNSGETPTRNLKWFWYLRCNESILKPQTVVRRCGSPITPSPSLIGPKSSVVEAFTTFDHSVVDYMKDGGTPEVSGWISYFDVAGRRHRTFWCYMLKWSQPGSGGAGKAQALSCHKRHPCSDSECNVRKSGEPDLDSEMRAAFAVDGNTVPPDFLPVHNESSERSWWELIFGGIWQGLKMLLGPRI